MEKFTYRVSFCFRHDIVSAHLHESNRSKNNFEYSLLNICQLTQNVERRTPFFCTALPIFVCYPFRSLKTVLILTHNLSEFRLMHNFILLKVTSTTTSRARNIEGSTLFACTYHHTPQRKRTSILLVVKVSNKMTAVAPPRPIGQSELREILAVLTRVE
jgi:hypothetical protein